MKQLYFTHTYLSEEMDFLPSHCLLNKGITGCGGTTLELQSKRNSIILCPTKNLVTSKSNLGYFGITGDTTNTQIKDYLLKEQNYRKIVATYDSLERIIKIVPNYQDYFLLIDEYHLLFNDYSFRGDVIKFILYNYTKFKDWCFMTATPLKDECILDELKDITRIECIWEKARKVHMHITDTGYTQKTLKTYMEYFKDRNLHIFLNSVKTIYSITKDIDDSLFRVVCAENSKAKITNFAKITSPIKKYNFYTSCAFEGCDIYDPDGICIILCDTNISTTILDIATKVRQICGRLRDSKYKDECYLILNSSKHRYANTPQHDFLKEVERAEHLGHVRMDIISKLNSEQYETELRTYSEMYSNIYLNKFDNRIFYDENLKKIDLYNYKLISEIYNNSISVIGECEQHNIIAEKQEIYHSTKKALYDWIILNKAEYTYQELEDEFKPLFETHGIKWNKNTTIRKYFPSFTKKQKMVNKVRDTYYIFDI